MTRLLPLLTVLAVATAPAAARATGFTDIGQDIEREGDEGDVELDASMRVRGELLHNLDLDRGPTPSGQLFFPVPLSDADGQTLTHADMRLRTDVALYAPGGMVAVKARLDFLDDLAMGSLPDAPPTATTSQRSPDDPVHVERAYAEVLTPVGVLTAGRMGSHWGLGILANGGDCADCDSGDSADRVAFLTPMLGHIWAVAYDISASGPFVPRRAGRRVVDLDPSDDASTVTVAVLHHEGELSRRRRRRAGRTTLEYGAWVSHRWQERDVPAHYLPTATPRQVTPAQSMHRGFTATAVDGWARLTHPAFLVELEAALVTSTLEQPSVVPGALLRDPLESFQYGAALESEIGAPEDPVAGGLDAGLASGDPAPGFGAFPRLGQPAPVPGDLDGPQSDPPRDTRVDNFRFHPDYRVDRILFREIVGTVTDAFYVRPHIRWTLWRATPGSLTVALAGVGSWAVEPSSAPGGERPLGVEIDPTVVYRSRDGYHVALEHAVLFPLGGLSNAALDLSARPAQLLRLRLGMVY